MRDGTRDALRFFGIEKRADDSFGDILSGGIGAGLGHGLGGFGGEALADYLGKNIDPEAYKKRKDTYRFIARLLGQMGGTVLGGTLGYGLSKGVPFNKTALHPAAWGAMIGTPIGAGAGYYVAPKDESPFPYMAGGALSGGLLGTSLGGLGNLLFGGSAPVKGGGGGAVSTSGGAVYTAPHNEVLEIFDNIFERNVAEGNMTREMADKAKQLVRTRNIN